MASYISQVPALNDAGSYIYAIACGWVGMGRPV